MTREQGTGNREQVLDNFTFRYLCCFFRSPTYHLLMIIFNS
ncbi:hypothetical protein [Dolichospermum circinale]|uniref:Uncharacterized protein n=1 Tax=Dolichospermum circinale CS-537/01 TaxID=3021739 RepID=A0ABT5A5S9_9CYAN|nr:hypothetical protein [Dolichospermum circinale]MDB9487311.1 hypothetical protein [Dolichospermum circinale CS-537/01]